MNEHCIEVTVDGAKVWAMPILLSRQERFDPAAGVPFFGYLTLSMLLVDRSRNAGAARPLERDGAPVLVPMNRVDGLFEQVGRNTNYVIHAEEILASNFELLVHGRAGCAVAGSARAHSRGARARRRRDRAIALVRRILRAEQGACRPAA